MPKINDFSAKKDFVFEKINNVTKKSADLVTEEIDALPNLFVDSDRSEICLPQQNLRRRQLIKFFLLSSLLVISIVIIWNHFKKSTHDVVNLPPVTPAPILAKTNTINITPLVDNIMPSKPLTIPLANGGQKARTISDRQLEYIAITINKSIYRSGRNAGLSKRLIDKAINIFRNEVNFAKDVHDGDKFVLLYRKQPHTIKHNKKIDRGYDILAAEVTTHNRGKIHRAIRFTDLAGHTDYYTPEGLSLNPAFVRYPTDHVHITSKFSYHRWHPILHFFRSHLGVDFAGPIGTPVKATGNGKIVFMGRKGNSGKTVIIQHDGKYSTLYAHLSRFPAKMHVGSFVQKQQVIGYIGSTGLSTGPHVHYEFRVYGMQHDPLKINLPHLAIMSKSDRIKFFATSRILLAELHDHYPQFATNNIDMKLSKPA